MGVTPPQLHQMLQVKICTLQAAGNTQDDADQ